MPDVAVSIAQVLAAKIGAATTTTARGTVVATATDGFVTFSVGGLATPRKGVWLGPGVPQVGEVITYIDEGRGIPLVLGPTGPQDLHISATKALIVGNTTVNNAGVTLGAGGTFVDSSGNLRAAINALLPTAWVPVTFQNGWSNIAGGFMGVGYRKVGDVVQLKGLMGGGTVAAGTPAFTLPSGFRPPLIETFAVVASNAFGRINVQPDGVMAVEIGANTFVSVSGVFFSITA